MYKKLFIVMLLLLTMLSQSQCLAKVKEQRDDFTGNAVFYTTFNTGFLGQCVGSVGYTFLKVANKDSSPQYFLDTYIVGSNGRVAFANEANIKIGDKIYVLYLIKNNVESNPGGQVGVYGISGEYRLSEEIINAIKQIPDYSFYPITIRTDIRGYYHDNEDCFDTCKLKENNFKEIQQILLKN